MFQENYGGKDMENECEGNENRDRKQKVNRNHIINNNITYCLIMNNLHLETNTCIRVQREKKMSLEFYWRILAILLIDIVQIRLFAVVIVYECMNVAKCSLHWRELKVVSDLATKIKNAQVFMTTESKLPPPLHKTQPPQW